MTDIFYHAIGESLATMLSSAAGVAQALNEPSEVQLNAANTPLVIVRLGDQGVHRPRAAGSYYTEWNYSVEVYCVDVSNYAEAARVRSDVMNSCMNAVRDNSRFHPDLEKSLLGAFEFDSAADEESNWWVALARFDVQCFAYYDR